MPVAQRVEKLCSGQGGSSIPRRAIGHNYILNLEAGHSYIGNNYILNLEAGEAGLLRAGR